jgi:hypothetical protein
MNSHIIYSELLTRKEAAAHLKICRTTLDRLQIPRIKIRRRVFFKKATLEQWLEEHTQVKGGQV